jgi:putative DNA primase/helicase
MTEEDIFNESDPFAPISNDETAHPQNNPVKEEVWRPITPAPGEPPPAGQIRHSKHGPATACYVYRNASGEPLMAAVRFEFTRPDGTRGKALLPYAYGLQRSVIKTGPNAGRRFDKAGWQFKRLPIPVPLYNLDRLAAAAGKPVLICEGEKTAGAAKVRFPSHVCVTSQGGSGAAGNADWSPLLDRDVTIWPDNDEPGASYSAAVAGLLEKAGARLVRIVNVPKEWPQGWDLADEPPNGVTCSMLEEMLTTAMLFSVGRDGGVPESVVATEVARVTKLSETEYALQRVALAKKLAIRVSMLDRLRSEGRKKAHAEQMSGAVSRCDGWLSGNNGVRIRTDLFVDDADLPDTAAELGKELAKSEHLFDRSGPCRLAHDALRGGSVIRPLKAAGVVTECHAVCRPWQWRTRRDGERYRHELTLPDRVAILCLDVSPGWGLRPLNGITGAPLLHGDGSVRIVDGYDPQSALYCEKIPSVDLPDIPTRSDALEAMRRLRIVIRTFAFADAVRTTIPEFPEPVVDIDLPPGADESAFLTMILTAVCRPSLGLAPGLVIRAPEVSGAGTGKGLLVRFLGIIAFGIEPRAMTAGGARRKWTNASWRR